MASPVRGFILAARNWAARTLSTRPARWPGDRIARVLKPLMSSAAVLAVGVKKVLNRCLFGLNQNVRTICHYLAPGGPGRFSAMSSSQISRRDVILRRRQPIPVIIIENGVRHFRRYDGA